MDSSAGEAPPSAASTLLASLAAKGIDYFFANPGTDFPPIIESFARAAKSGSAVPRPVLVPHENAAVAMAHGVYMVSGRPQAVMVHVNVGTGNTLNCLINAARDEVPILLMAGRSPLTEGDAHGARNRHIHWAQEMFDQAGMLREIVKWDYELRTPDQVEDVVARAIERATASPRGPIYLSLPREVLAAPVRASNRPPARRAPVEAAYPDPQAIATLAGWIAAAERPLVITGHAGREPAGALALARLAERFALPVVTFNPRSLCLPSGHPMHQGYQPRALLEKADLVIVLESDVPWFPSEEAPPEAARIVHIGEDPTYARYPIRSFPTDLVVTARVPVALGLLEEALAERVPAGDAKIAERRRHHAARAAELRQRWAKDGEEAGKAGFIKPEWISRCLRAALDPDAIVVNEYPLRLEHFPQEKPGGYFALSPAGGLGWSLPAALGAKLAAPDRFVCAVMGDGAYIFANPTACHWAAAAHKLPILAIVFNNGLYGAVRRATLSMYADGVAAEGQGRFLAELGPPTDYEKLVEANGGYGARVEKPDELPAALARAVAVVTRERRQALVNVVCQY
jgi:acetolactate synthase I/II/III large subunit